MKGGLVCLGSLETSALPSPFDRVASLADNGSGAERQRPAAGSTHRAGSGQRAAGGAAAQCAVCAWGPPFALGLRPSCRPESARLTREVEADPAERSSLSLKGFPCPWAPLRKEPQQRPSDAERRWEKGLFEGTRPFTKRRARCRPVTRLANEGRESFVVSN